MRKIVQTVYNVSLNVPLDMKGCICHFTEWQIHPFIAKVFCCVWDSVIHLYELLNENE